MTVERVERDGPGRRADDQVSETMENAAAAAALAAVNTADRAVKHAEDAEERSRRILRIVLATLALELVTVLTFGVVVLLLISAFRNENRRTQRNNCEAGNVTRVDLHKSARQGSAINSPKLLYERRITLPIRECEPALRGKTPIPLALPEQIRFENFYIRFKRVPLTKDGRVVWRVNPRVPRGR